MRPKPRQKKVYKTQRFTSPEGEKWRSLDRELTDREVEILYKSALNTCLFHLARAPQTEKQLRDRLIYKKDIPDPIIEETFKSLREYGYIDDVSYAQNLYEGYRSTHSRKAITQKLRKKGISSEVIEELFDSITPEETVNEYDIAKEFILTRLNALKNKAPEKRFNSIVSILANRGFGGDIVYPLAKEITSMIEEGDM